MHPANRLIAAAIALSPQWVGAATLGVGSGQAYALPSQAIAAARDGDTVAIQPGRYADCATIRQNGLTIEGVGAGVVLTGAVCDDKAILVAAGDDLTVRNLTLRGARSSWQNGAGIRAQGKNLTVRGVRFIDDQNGILGAPVAGSVVRVHDSTFQDDGHCGADCAHGVYFARVARVEIAHSWFIGTREGHAIKSRALSTIVTDCTIEDGPKGTSSYAIDIPNGGDVVVSHTTIEKGPRSSARRYGIMIGEEGLSNASSHLVFHDDVFRNDSGERSIFVTDLTETPAELSGNEFRGGAISPLAISR